MNFNAIHILYLLAFIFTILITLTPLIVISMKSWEYFRYKKLKTINYSIQDKKIKRIFIFTILIHGVIFFIVTYIRKSYNLYNNDYLLSITIIVISSFLTTSFITYKLCASENYIKNINLVIISVAIFIALVMTLLPNEKNFFLIFLYNLLYVSIPAFTVYFIQKKDSDFNENKINNINEKIDHIEKEILTINKKLEKILDSAPTKKISFLDKLKNFIYKN